jgi:hypothetical protein
MELFEKGKWGIIACDIVCRMYVVVIYVGISAGCVSKHSEMARKETT